MVRMMPEPMRLESGGSWGSAEDDMLINGSCVPEPMWSGARVRACEPRARALRLAARFGALAAVVWSSYTSITAPSSGRARGAWAHWRVLRLEVQLL